MKNKMNFRTKIYLINQVLDFLEWDYGTKEPEIDTYENYMELSFPGTEHNFLSVLFHDDGDIEYNFNNTPHFQADIVNKDQMIEGMLPLSFLEKIKGFMLELIDEYEK